MEKFVLRDERGLRSAEQVAEPPAAAKSRKTLYFIGHKLVDAEDQKVFVIDPRFDFIAFEGTVFIGRKSAFETSMNFREGMKQKGAELLDSFKELDLLSDV